MIYAFLQFLHEPTSVQLLLYSLMARHSAAAPPPSQNLLPCMNGTESDRWPEENEYRAADRRKERNLERKRGAQEENKGGMWMERVYSDRLQLVFTAVLSHGKASCLQPRVSDMKTMFLLESGRRSRGTREEKLGITAVASVSVASAFDGLSEKHCAKAHCVFADVIYVVAAVASGGRGLAVITLKYCSGLDLYIPSSFQPGSAVVMLQHSAGFIKNTDASLSTFLQESTRLLKEPLFMHTQLTSAACWIDGCVCVCVRETRTCKRGPHIHPTAGLHYYYGFSSIL